MTEFLCVMLMVHSIAAIFQDELKAIVFHGIGIALFTAHHVIFKSTPEFSLPSLFLFASSCAVTAYAMWLIYAQTKPEVVDTADHTNVRKKIVVLLEGNEKLSELEETNVYRILADLQNNNILEVSDACFIDALTNKEKEKEHSSQSPPEVLTQ